MQSPINRNGAKTNRSHPAKAIITAACSCILALAGSSASVHAASYTWASQSDWSTWSLSGTSAGNSTGVSLNITGHTDSLVSKNAVLPDPSFIASSAFDTANGKAYIFGGIDKTAGPSTAILEYSPLTDTIITKSAVFPTAVFLEGSAYDPADGKIYIFGGQGSAIYAYDPSTDTLATKSSTVPAGGWTSAVFNNSMGVAYLFSSGHIYAYTPATDTIVQKGPALPAASGTYYSVAMNPATSKAYVFGGTSGGTLTNEILAYDPSTDTLSTENAVLPIGLVCTVAIYDNATGKIEIFGGKNPPVSQIYSYDPTADTLQVQPSALPSARSNIAVAHDPGTNLTYLFGGSETDAPSGNVGQILAYNGHVPTYPLTGTASTTFDPVPGQQQTWNGSALTDTLNGGSVADTYSLDGTAYGPFSGVQGKSSEKLYVRLALATPNSAQTPVVSSLNVSYTATPAPLTLGSVNGSALATGSAAAIVSATSRPSFSGTAPAGSAVTVTVHSDPVTCTATADANGNWGCAVSRDLPSGAHTVYVTAVTPAGAQLALASFPLSVASQLAGTGSDTSVPTVLGLLAAFGASLALFRLRRR